VTVIPIDTAAAPTVFDWYFARKPPFSDKKKSEFPDAFNLSTLERWCSAENQECYVIADDPDIEKYCETSERLTHLNRPGEYADLYSMETEAYRAVEQSTNEHLGDVERAITAEFENSGFILDDIEGDIHEVRVEKVEMDDASLLSVDGNVARFDIFCHIEFTADVEYDDYDTAIWDSEDKVAIPLHKIRNDVDREWEGSVTLDVNLENGGFHSIRTVALSERDITFSAKDDDYPYK
jgi:hypothetical protein